MFVELYDKFRVNVINIASYYPYDETRIMVITFKPIDKNGQCNEILMCGDIDTRNKILERLDEICNKERMVAVQEKEKGITLE
jgi:hypothetical protein